MTLPMLLWTIVAILALVGLIRLAVRQPVKPKGGAYPPARSPGAIDFRIVPAPSTTAAAFVAQSLEEPMASKSKPEPRFEVFPGKRKGHHVRLRAANGRILFHTEAFTRKRDADRAIATIREAVAVADVVHTGRPGN